MVWVKDGAHTPLGGAHGDSRGALPLRAVEAIDPSLEAAEVLAAPKGLKPAQPDQNEARRRRQAARGPRTVEDHAQSVRKPRATTLVVPEEKRCEALTNRGTRCRAPRLRGLRVCMFHGHLSGDDERLAALADPDPLAKPRLSPRSAMKAVAELRAGEMAYAAVDGAIQRAPSDGGRAALAIVDAVDPMLDSTLTLRVNSPSDVEGLSFAELALAVRQLTPSSGSTSHVEAAEGAKQHADLEA